MRLGVLQRPILGGAAGTGFNLPGAPQQQATTQPTQMANRIGYAAMPPQSVGQALFGDPQTMPGMMKTQRRMA